MATAKATAVVFREDRGIIGDSRGVPPGYLERCSQGRSVQPPFLQPARNGGCILPYLEVQLQRELNVAFSLGLRDEPQERSYANAWCIQNG